MASWQCDTYFSWDTRPVSIRLSVFARSALSCLSNTVTLIIEREKQVFVMDHVIHTLNKSVNEPSWTKRTCELRFIFHFCINLHRKCHRITKFMIKCFTVMFSSTFPLTNDVNEISTNTIKCLIIIFLELYRTTAKKEWSIVTIYNTL